MWNAKFNSYNFLDQNFDIHFTLIVITVLIHTYVPYLSGIEALGLISHEQFLTHCSYEPFLHLHRCLFTLEH